MIISHCWPFYYCTSVGIMRRTCNASLAAWQAHHHVSLAGCNTALVVQWALAHYAILAKDARRIAPCKESTGCAGSSLAAADCCLGLHVSGNLRLGLLLLLDFVLGGLYCKLSTRNDRLRHYAYHTECFIMPRWAMPVAFADATYRKKDKQLKSFKLLLA
jgi:hypothetical protein